MHREEKRGGKKVISKKERREEKEVTAADFLSPFFSLCTAPNRTLSTEIERRKKEGAKVGRRKKKRKKALPLQPDIYFLSCFECCCFGLRREGRGRGIGVRGENKIVADFPPSVLSFSSPATWISEKEIFGGPEEPKQMGP